MIAVTAQTRQSSIRCSSQSNVLTEPEAHMKRIAKAATIGMTVLAISGAGAIAAQASGNDHGKAVSEIAKAADFASGRAHGAAVSAEAKSWGAARSAAARAKGAAHAAAGKANGHDASEPGRLKSQEARS